jgi:hypothetical protein
MDYPRRWLPAAIVPIVLGLLLGHPATSQEKLPPPAGPRRPAPTAEQMTAWVKELDADEFLARETAMLSLIEAGPAAISVIQAEAGKARSIEAATRITHILQTLGLSADFDVQEAARVALAELAGRARDAAVACAPRPRWKRSPSMLGSVAD